MKNKNKMCILIVGITSLIFVSLILGYTIPVPENNYSMEGSLKVYYPNPHADYLVPDLATLIQGSDIIVEATVVDMKKKQIISNDYEEVADIPREIQDAEYTVKVNEILKTDQDIGEIILNIEGNIPDLIIGNNLILYIEKSPSGNSFNYNICTPSGILIQNEEGIYKGLYHQIDLTDLKIFIQKPDYYFEKYHNAATYYDIVVAQMLTNTNDHQIEYNQSTDVLPHQIHKIKVIHSASIKLIGNTEFDYRIWYYPEEIFQKNNLTESHHFPNWIKTDEGYYQPEIWDPETSFLKKDEYYIIYVYKEDSFYNKNGIIGSYSIEKIPKYDSKTQKELKSFIEEYQELYELIKKYEIRE